jgi:hypothetical protein
MRLFHLVRLNPKGEKRRVITGVELDNGQAVMLDHNAVCMYASVEILHEQYSRADFGEPLEVEFVQDPPPPYMHNMSEALHWIESIPTRWSVSFERISYPHEGIIGWRLMLTDMLSGIQLTPIQRKTPLEALNEARQQYEEKLRT